MSQRGSGRGGEEPDNQDAEEEWRDDGLLLPPAGARPIAPYDPYRPRQVESYAPPPRRPTRPASTDPFLPDDDPLNADAWQLEIEEVETGGDDAAALDTDLVVPPPPRRPRRSPTAARQEREPGASGQQGRRARPRSTAARSTSPRGAVSIGVPRVVSGSPLAADQTALILLGISAASILVMALMVGIRLGSIPSPTVLHLDAAGNPDRWGSPAVLWRLPLMSFFITALFLVVAWRLYPIDRFGARFALAVPVIVQLIAWVAVIQHVG